MERRFERHGEMSAPARGFMQMATDGIMTNLPILVCGLVVGLIVIVDLF